MAFYLFILFICFLTDRICFFSVFGIRLLFPNVLVHDGNHLYSSYPWCSYFCFYFYPFPRLLSSYSSHCSFFKIFVFFLLFFAFHTHLFVVQSAALVSICCLIPPAHFPASFPPDRRPCTPRALQISRLPTHGHQAQHHWYNINQFYPTNSELLSELVLTSKTAHPHHHHLHYFCNSLTESNSENSLQICSLICSFWLPAVKLDSPNESLQVYI